jgi:hypothetical protein
MKCPICHRQTDILRTAIKDGFYVSERCDNCLNSFTSSSVYARKYERDRGREDYRKDIIQRFEGDKPNSEFIKAYPKESQQQWDENTLRKFS